MKAVHITWQDSVTDTHSWVLDNEQSGEELKPVMIDTYGVIVKETVEYVCVAQNYGTDPNQYCNTMIIPRGCIESITDICEKNFDIFDDLNEDDQDMLEEILESYDALKFYIENNERFSEKEIQTSFDELNTEIEWITNRIKNQNDEQ